MSTSAVDTREALARDVIVTEDTLTVEMGDGRAISVPLAWYPRLHNGTQAERENWRFIGQGSGLHWPDLDEDISVAGLLAGQPSQESQTSLARWLEHRGESPGNSAHGA